MAERCSLSEHRAVSARLRCEHRLSAEPLISTATEAPEVQKKTIQKKLCQKVNPEKDFQEQNSTMVPGEQEVSGVQSDILKNGPKKGVRKSKATKSIQPMLQTPNASEIELPRKTMKKIKPIAVQNSEDGKLQVGSPGSKKNLKKSAVEMPKIREQRQVKRKMCDSTNPDYIPKKAKQIPKEKADELITMQNINTIKKVKLVRPPVPLDITKGSQCLTKKSIIKNKSPFIDNESESPRDPAPVKVKNKKQIRKPKIVPTLNPLDILGLSGQPLEDASSAKPTRTKTLLKAKKSKKWVNPNPKNVIKVKIKPMIAEAEVETPNNATNLIEESNKKIVAAEPRLVKPKTKPTKSQAVVTKKRGPQKKVTAVTKREPRNTRQTKSNEATVLIQKKSAKLLPKLRPRNYIDNNLSKNKTQIQPDIVPETIDENNKHVPVPVTPKINKICDNSSPSCSSFKSDYALDNDGKSSYSLHSWARDISSSSGEVVPIAGKVPTLRLSKLDCGNYRSQIKNKKSPKANCTKVSNDTLYKINTNANKFSDSSEYSDIVKTCNSVVNLSTCTSVEEDKEMEYKNQQISNFLTKLFRLADDSWISQLDALTKCKKNQSQEKESLRNITKTSTDLKKNNFCVDNPTEIFKKTVCVSEMKSPQENNKTNLQNPQQKINTAQAANTNIIMKTAEVPNIIETEKMPPPNFIIANYSRVVKNTQLADNTWINKVLNNIPTDSFNIFESKNDINNVQVRNSPGSVGSSDSDTSTSESSTNYEPSSCSKKNTSAQQNEEDEEDIVSLYAAESLTSFTTTPLKPSNKNMLTNETKAKNITVPFKCTSQVIPQHTPKDEAKPQRIIFEKTHEEKIVPQKVICEKQNADSTSVSNVKSNDINESVRECTNETENNRDNIKSILQSNYGIVDPKSFPENRHLLRRLMFLNRKSAYSQISYVCYNYLLNTCQTESCRYQHIPIPAYLDRIRPSINNVQMFTKEYLHIRTLKHSCPKLDYDSMAKVFITTCIAQKWLFFLLELAIDAVFIAAQPKRLLAMCIRGLNLIPLHKHTVLLCFKMTSDRYLIDILLQEIAVSESFRDFDSALMKLVRYKTCIKQHVELATACKIVEQVSSMQPHKSLIREIYCSVICNTDATIWSNVSLLEKFKMQLMKDETFKGLYDNLVENIESFAQGRYTENQNLNTLRTLVSGDQGDLWAAEGPLSNKSMVRAQNPSANMSSAREGVRYTSPDTTQYQEFLTTKKPGALLSLKLGMTPPQSAGPPRQTVWNPFTPQLFNNVRQPQQNEAYVSQFRPRVRLAAPRFNYTPVNWNRH